MAEYENADVPPLEDLSEVLERAKAARSQLQREKPNPSPGGREKPCSNGASVKTATGVESGASQSESPPKRPRAGKTKRKVTEGAVRENESFGGFGKGFLLSTPAERTVKTVSRSSGATKSTGTAGGNATPSSKASTFEGERFSSGTSPTATTTSDDIPFLRAQPQAAENRGPVFPEVQEAMKEAYPLLNTQDWATESLLKKIERHPLLSRALTNPHLSELLSRFQSNPKEALQVAAGNPEMQHFLREFCNLMGDHFTELADREEGGGKGEKTDQYNQPQAAAPPVVDDEVKKVLEKKAVKDALSDLEVQQLISSLQRDPNKAQRLLTAGGAELRQKVQVLIDNGLLAMQ